MVTDPGAATGAARLRPLNQPQPLEVDAAPNGEPKAVLLRGRYLRVIGLRDSWRIDDEWWRDEISRRYFIADLEGGRQLTLYYDLLEDAWFGQPYTKPKGSRVG